MDDLQDMQNDLHAQTDEGLKRLSQSQGTNGMPAAPDVRQVPNPYGQGTADPDVVNQLRQQQQDANQTEREVRGGRGPGGDDELVRFVPTFPMMPGSSRYISLRTDRLTLQSQCTYGPVCRYNRTF